MGRIFEEHLCRQVKSLDGIWNFCKDTADQGINDKWYLGIPNAEITTVPSVWNTDKDNLTYEGVAWYEKTFHTDGGCLRFCFGAVMTQADIWLDGEHIGSHYGGFTQFDIIVSNVTAGEHRLTVRADNRFDEHSIPQAKVDWYHYGGIPRSVTVETLKGISVLSNRFEYTLSNGLDCATGHFVLELYNAEKDTASDEITAELGDSVVSRQQVELEGGAYLTLTLPEITLNGIELWDIGKPTLYNISLSTSTDDLRDRVGFRRIEVRDNAVFLNGKNIELRGVNRHEEHPDWGFAVPFSIEKRDTDLALAMGCNAIRGSHYPNAQEFVDLLDERGILFWSEIPIWGGGFSEKALADPTVISRGLEMHREMVKHYYNHPCIIIWGLHNEILSGTSAAYDISKLYYGYLKENGGNRLVVYASDKPMEDICFEFSDVFCLNQYFGWYYGYEPDAWEKFTEQFCQRRKALGMENKPIIFSEFGCAALYGCHDNEDILWTEENQAKQLSHCLEVFHEHPAVVGSFIWQFCDMRTCFEAGITRARGFNNKGILNEYRKPKLAYHAASRLYNKFKGE